MVVTNAYTYLPDVYDLKEHDTGWLPESIDMLALVGEYDRWQDEGRESDWWGSLHNDSHPDTCVNCMDVNIYTEDSILDGKVVTGM